MNTATSGRREATERRRTEILEAALRCFTEQGVVATTMEDIRSEAQVSVGSLYHHFDSKEAIAAALHVALIARYQVGAEEVFKHRTPRQWIQAAVAHHVLWSVSNPAATRFLLSHREPEVKQLVDGPVAELNRAIEGRIEEWLDDQIAAGQIRRIPIDIFISLVIGPAQFFVRRWAMGMASTSPEKAVQALGKAAWESVRNDSRRQSVSS